MPVVIHELIVTAEVQQQLATESSREGGAPARMDREELIRECTEQVLKQLERRYEK